MAMTFCMKSVLRESEQVHAFETKLMWLTKLCVYFVTHETLLSNVCLQNFQIYVLL